MLPNYERRETWEEIIYYKLDEQSLKKITENNILNDTPIYQ